MKTNNDARERDLAFGWHVVHTIIALIGLFWSFYWWRKRKLVKTQ